MTAAVWQFYNLPMQITALPTRLFALSLSLMPLLCGLAQAQAVPASTAAQAPTASAPSTSAPKSREQLTERIHLEDSGSVIDEVRIGGETKSINVQPKGGMPAYQVAPVSGERSWKVLGF